MTAEPLVLTVVAKGSLHDGTLDLLDRCFIPIKRGSRSYAARMAGLPGVEVLLSRADEIPELVASGQAHAGITGLDLVSEVNAEPGAARSVQVVIEDLRFGRADLVLGVPAVWLDVAGLDDLVEVAADLRHEHGRVLRVATKFPNLTRSFFARAGFGDYRIVPSLGATEGAPKAGTADVVVDLTSTGTTLEANGLKQIAGGRALRSQACLVATPDPAVWTPPRRQAFTQVIDLVESALAAGDTRVVRAHFADADDGCRAALDAVLLDSAWIEADHGTELDGHLAVADVHEVLRLLRAHGAQNAVVEAVDLMVRPTHHYASAFFAAVDAAP
ncbi:MAG: ATP phosphoribosyltransferase [Acidimicrobiales bacterium]|nr:ATP phosphoribosyltransferase [Acidimicrobiales bacterium]MCB9372951.1 ATP phosphoribosyltransferase [Microthrixaceae bacterium]